MQRLPALHPPVKQGGLAPPAPYPLQVVCLAGPLGAMSGEHDPLEEPRASAWLQRLMVHSGLSQAPEDHLQKIAKIFRRN